MTDQPDILTLDQQRRVVLAQKARGILTNTTLVSSSGPPADEVVKLAIWLEGPGDDVPGPSEGWGEDRYTEPCCDEDREPQDVWSPETFTTLGKPYDQLSQEEKGSLDRLSKAVAQQGVDDRREQEALRLLQEARERAEAQPRSAWGHPLNGEPSEPQDKLPAPFPEFAGPQIETEDQYGRGTE